MLPYMDPLFRTWANQYFHLILNAECLIGAYTHLNFTDLTSPGIVSMILTSQEKHATSRPQRWYLNKIKVVHSTDLNHVASELEERDVELTNYGK